MGKIRALLVDDEEELVSTMAERLSLRGIDADWAGNAEDAIRMLEQNRYDVAVLDVKIPRVSGITLKKEMEKLRPDMKFIFLTGHGSEADFRIGLAEAGADYYLVKPIGIEELIERMEEILGQKGDGA